MRAREKVKLGVEDLADSVITLSMLEPLLTKRAQAIVFECQKILMEVINDYLTSGTSVTQCNASSGATLWPRDLI